MPYVQVNVSDRKKSMMADCEKMMDALIENQNCGYAMSDNGEFIFIILRKPS
ncbi:MAG: hypothetical protein M0R06_05885 [Sphaerochaeta sp.]|nr:hypothetical protein [Sphaerochaeta sp.]